MRASHRRLLGAMSLLVSASFGCSRAPESSPPGGAGSVVRDDVKGLAKTTEKTAKDIGHAATDVANKAGDGLQDATNKAGAGGQDAWITTKVKSALTSEGLDPLHVHVDTEAKVVTLSGSVDSASKREKALAVAKGIAGVVDVKDHLFVKPDVR
jgi:hyperosmotically inducible protein